MIVFGNGVIDGKENTSVYLGEERNLLTHDWEWSGDPTKYFHRFRTIFKDKDFNFLAVLKKTRLWWAKDGLSDGK